MTRSTIFQLYRGGIIFEVWFIQ